MKHTEQKTLQTNPKPFHHKRNTNKKHTYNLSLALNAKNLAIASCVTLNTQI